MSQSFKSTQEWKIFEDYKFFTEPNDSNDVPVIGAKEFCDVIGNAVPANEMIDYVENLNAYYADGEVKVDIPKTKNKPSSQMSTFSASTFRTTEDDVQKTKKRKNIRFSSAPHLTIRQLKSIYTFVSIHLDASALTWTEFRVNRNDEQTTITAIKWNCEETRYERHQSWHLLAELQVPIENIPKCDAYIIEAVPTISYRKNATIKQMNDLAVLGQCVSIIAATLATRNRATSYLSDPNVLFMGRDVMGKYYNLFVGNETVSVYDVVKEIIFDKRSGTTDCTEKSDITIEQEMRESFRNSSRIKREYLGKTMLIGITFFRLDIRTATYKNDSKNIRELET